MQFSQLLEFPLVVSELLQKTAFRLACIEYSERRAVQAQLGLDVKESILLFINEKIHNTVCRDEGLDIIGSEVKASCWASLGRFSQTDKC